MQTLLAATWTPKEIGVVIAVGLVAGLLARAILPGKQHMNMIFTIVLGVAGAFVGAFVQGWFKIGGDEIWPWQILFATGGSLVLLILLCLFGVFKKN
jgi:uncharacterized membrane protein YeaQ/YmgE (transglycosylase-associated protein family)